MSFVFFLGNEDLFAGRVTWGRLDRDLAAVRLLGRQAQMTLCEGIAKTYAWVEGQVRRYGG